MTQQRNMGLIWHVQEYRDRPDERIDRKELAKVIGVSLDALSNLRSRYYDDYPQVIASQGRQTWYSRTEAQKFGEWLKTLKDQGVGLNQGIKGPSRSPLKVAESELVRVQSMLDRATAQEAKTKLAWDKAAKNRKEIARRVAQLQERVAALTTVQQ